MKLHLFPICSNSAPKRPRDAIAGFVTVLLLATQCCVGASSSATVDETALRRADAALAKLTLEEKISLLAGSGTMSINALPKIGLNEEFWFSDSSHTVRRELDRKSFGPAGRTDDHATVLPTLSALAATWDVALARRFGEVLGAEARDRGKDVMLGPGLNLLRTPLCGRNFEYFGEDPHLAARMAVAHISGVQSKNVGACAKHFVANEQELSRMNVDSAPDERTLREIYLPPFEAAVKEAGVLVVMNGYNRFRGEFCSHNHALNQGLLKDEWGFPGFVVSDWGGLHNTLGGALGGLDVEMNAGAAIKYFKQPLIDAVNAGKVPVSVIDDKARRVLYVMAVLGNLGGVERAPGARNTPEHQTFAREVAEQAIVLLKNDKKRLPLDSEKLKRVLVIGRNADAKFTSLGGSAEGKAPYEITPLEALRKRLGEGTQIDYLPGPFVDQLGGIPDSVIETVDASNLTQGLPVKGWRAQFFRDHDLSAAPLVETFERSARVDWRGQLPKPGLSDDFVLRLSSTIVAPETGDYVLGADHDGYLRVRVGDDLVVDAWQPGPQRRSTGRIRLEKGQTYDIVVELGRHGHGRMQFGWQLPSQTPLTPAEIVERARTADAVVVFTGNGLGTGPTMEGEGADRPDMRPPAGHAELLAALLAARPDTVVIHQSGSPVEMPWIDQAPTVVQYWFSGMEGGSALVRLLLGDVNFSGKLPFTFPKRLEDSPAHALTDYAPNRVHYKEGLFVGYRWFDDREIEPLFWFGHGLSYTEFELGPLAVSPQEFDAKQRVIVRVPVKNIGKRAGAEVVQLYVGDPQASVPRPPKELKGFRKVFLAPGETQTVEFHLSARDFSYWDVGSNSWKAEPGEFRLWIGTAMNQLPRSATVTLR